MPYYRVTVSVVSYEIHHIEADSENEAREIAEEGESIPVEIEPDEVQTVDIEEIQKL